MHTNKVVLKLKSQKEILDQGYFNSPDPWRFSLEMSLKAEWGILSLKQGIDSDIIPPKNLLWPSRSVSLSAGASSFACILVFSCVVDISGHTHLRCGCVAPSQSQPAGRQGGRLVHWSVTWHPHGIVDFESMDQIPLILHLKRIINSCLSVCIGMDRKPNPSSRISAELV